MYVQWCRHCRQLVDADSDDPHSVVLDMFIADADRFVQYDSEDETVFNDSDDPDTHDTNPMGEFGQRFFNTYTFNYSSD